MVKNKITVAESIIKNLIFNNIDTFFLVTGGAIAPMVDLIGQFDNAKYFCFQHEQSAAMAAESYYRTTGKIGAVLSTSGPGAQNLLNGICGCYYESIPCVFITGQVSTYESLDSIKSFPRQVGFQETPIAESFKYFTKFSEKITKPQDTPKILSKALEECTNGRFGPVLIDIPLDIQISELNFNILKTPIVSLKDTTPIHKELRIILDKLKSSKRPLLLLGHGIKLSGASSLALELIEKTNIPFVVSWGGFDIIPHDHPQFVGDIGVYGSRGGNFAIQNCDLLISIGSRLDTRQTGGKLSTFSRESYKIVVDIDKNELFKDRGIYIDLPVIKNAYDFLKSLIQTLPFQPLQDMDNKWLSYITSVKSLKETRPVKENILTSYEFLEELNTQLPDNSTIIPDEGGHLVWSMQSIKIKGTQKLYSNFGNSSMGYALPASIGASLENKGPVICIDGDGGFQMNIQELQTVKHYNLPIKIFIMNNNCYGIIKQFQDAYFDSRYTATESQDYTAPDFVKVAEAYGIKAVRATKENYKEIIDLAMQEEGSILVDVQIDRDQKLIPKLEFGNPLEDMSPYLTNEQLASNMIISGIPRRDNTQGWVTLNK